MSFGYCPQCGGLRLTEQPVGDDGLTPYCARRVPAAEMPGCVFPESEATALSESDAPI